MDDTAVEEISYDLPSIIDRKGVIAQRTGYIDRGIRTIGIKESVCSTTIVVGSYDLAAVIDPVGYSLHGSWDLDSREMKRCHITSFVVFMPSFVVLLMMPLRFVMCVIIGVIRSGCAQFATHDILRPLPPPLSVRRRVSDAHT
jgi:hypothetical protein